jgi:hypothetical protein
MQTICAAAGLQMFTWRCYNGQPLNVVAFLLSEATVAQVCVSQRYLLCASAAVVLNLVTVGLWGTKCVTMVTSVASAIGYMLCSGCKCTLFGLQFNLFMLCRSVFAAMQPFVVYCGLLLGAACRFVVNQAP